MPFVHQYYHHFRGFYLRYFDYSQRHIITNSPIITDYDNFTGTVINITTLHDENTLLMLGVHILGEFYCYCFYIFCFSLESYFASPNNKDHILVNKCPPVWSGNSPQTGVLEIGTAQNQDLQVGCLLAGPSSPLRNLQVANRPC